MAPNPLRERLLALSDSRDPLRGSIRFTKYSFAHVIIYGVEEAFIEYIAKSTHRAEIQTSLLASLVHAFA